MQQGQVAPERVAAAGSARCSFCPRRRDPSEPHEVGHVLAAPKACDGAKSVRHWVQQKKRERTVRWHGRRRAVRAAVRRGAGGVRRRACQQRHLLPSVGRPTLAGGQTPAPDRRTLQESREPHLAGAVSWCFSRWLAQLRQGREKGAARGTTAFRGNSPVQARQAAACRTPRISPLILHLAARRPSAIRTPTDASVALGEMWSRNQ